MGWISRRFFNAPPTTAMFSSIESCFAPSLLSEKSQNAHKESYSASTPYRHAVVDGLLDQELLKKAREEIIEELRFAEKETDIYKVSKKKGIQYVYSILYVLEKHFSFTLLQSALSFFRSTKLEI